MVSPMDALLLAAGLIVLVKSADYFVDSASHIAKSRGVSEFVIGVTIVAIGTSIPELATAVSSSLEGLPTLSVGTVIGANVANVCLIVGVAALIAPIAVKSSIVKMEGYIMISVGIIFLLFAIIGTIGFAIGLTMVLVFFAYILFLANRSRGLGDDAQFHDFVQYFAKFGYLGTLRDGIKGGIGRVRQGEAKTAKLPLRAAAKYVLVMAACLAGIVIGSDWLVEGASGIVESLGIEASVVGLTVVALGTTMPELSVAINASRKGYQDLALGNAIGSTITNILLIIGVSAILSPIAVPPETVTFQIPFMLTAFVVLMAFMATGKIKRWMAASLLSMYGAFMAILLLFFI